MWSAQPGQLCAKGGIQLSIDVLEATLDLIAVSCALVFAGLAIREKDLVRAIVSYGLSSAFLAALFFSLSSPFAAMLELTVGAGLIVVLFLVSLTLSIGTESPSKEGTEWERTRIPEGGEP